MTSNPIIIDDDRCDAITDAIINDPNLTIDDALIMLEIAQTTDLDHQHHIPHIRDAIRDNFDIPNIDARIAQTERKA